MQYISLHMNEDLLCFVLLLFMQLFKSARTKTQQNTTKPKPFAYFMGLLPDT